MVRCKLKTWQMPGYPERNNNNNFSGSLRHFLRNSPLGALGSLL